MKNVSFKVLLCLVLFIFAACGDDSSSNSSDKDGGNGSVSSLLCLSTPLDGSDSECGNFVLNESDSSFSYSFRVNYTYCGGPDTLSMSWHKEKLLARTVSNYSIHNDSLYVRTWMDYSLEGAPYQDPIESDGGALVTILWSQEHDGIRGTWRYVNQYLDSPEGYVNAPFDNLSVFWTFSEDRLLVDTVENSNYNFFRTQFVEDLLLTIYKNDDSWLIPTDAGYFSKIYPYNSPSVDVQMVSSSDNEAVFMVKGQRVVISNVDVEMVYFSRFKVFMDVEYGGKKCSYRDYAENLSEQTCRAENVDLMYLYKRPNSYSTDPTVMVWSDEIRYEDNKREFAKCLGPSE
ncbi:MAG: hypothetical protein J5615_01760 [Fibrobacter sp.]|jgi:hypothetical protein|nr:hypothetical protein [Fibrobacter sp.]